MDQMNLKLTFLFLSGMFSGGTIDHIILATMGSGTSPFGFRIGIIGNWLMAALDTIIAIIFFWLYKIRKQM